MSGVNQVWILGYLGQDPELRTTSGGQSVLSARVATGEYFYDKDTKEKKEHTEWHTVVVWGKLAEAMSTMLVKGSRISARGSLRTRSWEDKTGNKRYATEIKAEDIQVLSSSRRQETTESERPTEPGTRSRRGVRAPEAPAIDKQNEDDIPF